MEETWIIVAGRSSVPREAIVGRLPSPLGYRRFLTFFFLFCSIAAVSDLSSASEGKPDLRPSRRLRRSGRSPSHRGGSPSRPRYAAYPQLCRWAACFFALCARSAVLVLIVQSRENAKKTRKLHTHPSGASKKEHFWKKMLCVGNIDFLPLWISTGLTDRWGSRPGERERERERQRRGSAEDRTRRDETRRERETSGWRGRRPRGPRP